MNVIQSEFGSTFEADTELRSPDFCASEHAAGPAEEDVPLDVVSKAMVMRALASVTSDLRRPLQELLEEHPELWELRSSLAIELGGEGVMVETRGSSLPSLFPARAWGWPVWYVRLPAAWAPWITNLVALDGFCPCIAPDPADPWYVAQWLALSVGGCTDENWRGTHLRIRDVDVRRSLHRHSVSTFDGVVVLFECAGWVDITAYPVDEPLLLSLQAGGAASSRKPWLDHTTAWLQSQVRDSAEGVPFPTDGALTIDVMHDVSEEELDSQSREQFGLEARIRTALAAQRPVVHFHGNASAAVGKLLTIADYVPAALEDDTRQWVKVVVPQRMFEGIVNGAAVDLQHAICPEALGSGKALVMTCGEDVVAVGFEPTFNLPAHGDERPVLAIECARSGYLHPIDGLSDMLARAPSILDVEEYAHRLGQDVYLYTSELLDARTWQQQEIDAAGLAEGPAGGLQRAEGVKDFRQAERFTH